MDVRYQISIRVGVCRIRTVGHIGRQTIAGRKTRPLTDEQNCYRWIEKCTHLIQDSNTAMTNHKHLADTRTSRDGGTKKERNQAGNLRGHGWN